MKFEFVATSSDGKTTGAVSADFVASRIANKSIGMISIAEGDRGFGFSLSDGGQIRFRLKQGGGEVVYYTPSGK